MITNRLTTSLILVVVGVGILLYGAFRKAGFMSSTSRVLRRARAIHRENPAASR